MERRALSIFLITIAVLVAAILWFIQSPGFATLVKSSVMRHLPSDFGIEGDFSEFTIKLFPPGISIQKPKVGLKKNNVLNLPEGSSITSEKLDLNFRPLQMFSGNIQVHEVIITNGDLKLRLDLNPPQKPSIRKKKTEFRWEDLLRIRTDALIVQNTRIHFESTDGTVTTQFNANQLRIAQWLEAGPGYELSMELHNLTGHLLSQFSLPKSIETIKGVLRVNSQGVWMDSLLIETTGLNLEAKGTIKGNILSPKSLPVDAQITLSGKADQVSEYFGWTPQKSSSISGIFSFGGKAKGDLLKLKESFQAEGDLRIENPRFQAWYADTLEAKASWLSTPSGGEIQVAKATLTTAPKARQKGEPGSGGRIVLGSFKFRPHQLQAFSVPVQLEQTHIHWLAAGAIEDVFPLDFTLRGGVEFSFTPRTRSSSWAIQLATDLAVEDFRLDNQKYRKQKPIRNLLRIPRLNLDGNLKIDSAGVHLGANEGLTLTLPNTKLKVTGDIDSKKGYDFKAAGPIQLDDIKELSEIPIHGAGTLAARIHGPSSRVILDFDADLKDAYYLRLRLGNLKGRITYDEAPSQLIFSDVLLKKGGTPYTGHGTIDLGANEQVNLDFNVSKGNIQDMVQIFHEQTADIWWFPNSIMGGIQGTVKVSGGLDMKSLKALGKLTGNNWEYLGERFRAVQLSGGLDRGTYLIDDFRATKQNGRLAGRISYAADNKIDWLLQSDNLTVLDIDHFAQLDVPMRGNISIYTAGKGSAEILSESRFSLIDFSVRGTPMPPSYLTVHSENGRLLCTALALGGQGSLELNYDFTPGASSYVHSDLKKLDFSPILLLLNPKLSQDKSLTSVISGSLNMNFKSGAADRGTGRVVISEYLLAKEGTRFELAQPMDIRVEDGSFVLKQLVLKGPQSEASLNLTSRNTALEGTILGAVDLSILEFLTPTVGKAEGAATVDLSLGGTIKAPTLFGKAKLEKASLWIPAVESPFENINGDFQLRQNVLSIRNLDSDLATGHISAGGSVEIFPNRYPTLSIKASINGSKLKVYPFQFVKVRGNLQVHGSELPYLVDGQMVIDSALSKEKVFGQKQGEGLRAAEYMPAPSSKMDSNYPKFRLNIDARADKGVIIQNDLFDAEAKGKLTIVNTLETPRIIGSAELVQGKINFKNRVFQIQTASATFDSPTVINPAFDLTAHTEVDNVKVQLYANGRMDRFKVELTSNPTMPETEILSLLAMGIPPNEVKKLNPTDRSVVEQGEAASLLLHSLDFNREVQSKTGFQIQLGESLDAKSGQSITKPPTVAEAGAAPKIVIKKQIGNKLDLSYGSTVGIGTNTRQEINAEYRFTPGFSVIGVYDNYETLDAQEKKSYGADIKFQKRFGK